MFFLINLQARCPLNGSIISIVMGSISAMPPMEPTLCMACKNTALCVLFRPGWLVLHSSLDGLELGRTFLESLRFHSSQCAVFLSHSAYVETSESWLSTNGSQMHCLRSCSSSGVARLLSSRGGSSAVSIRVHPSVDGCSSARTGACCVESEPQANQRCATGPHPWPMAGSDW